MKKLLNVILASFMVLGMIGCSNAAGGEAEFKVEQNGNKAEFILSNTGSVQNLWVSRKNVTKNTDFEDYIYVFKPAENNVSKITDYFVNQNNTYEYIFRCYTNGKKIYESKVFTAKAESGPGEVTLITLPVSTYNKETGVMNFTTKPNVADPLINFLEEKKGSLQYSIDYRFKDEVNDKDYWFEYYFDSKVSEIDCFKYVEKGINEGWENENILGKKLPLYRFMITANIGNVEYREYYDAKYFENLVKEITIPDLRPVLTATYNKDSKTVTFTLPDKNKKPKDATRYSIGRVDKANSDATDYHTKYFYLNGDDFGSTSLKDVQVESGHTYIYTFYYRRDELDNKGIIVSTLKPVEVVIPSN